MGFTFDDTGTKGVASPVSEMKRLSRGKRGPGKAPTVGFMFTNEPHETGS
jgi:hypothetical protein